MTIVYFDVDGQPVPADECTWVISAPCGCDCCWTTGRYCLTEDQAWEGFSRSKAARQRDEKLGYRLRIARHKGLVIADDCPHTPKWGVEPPPTPTGHTWATIPGIRTLHLVPVVIEKDSAMPLRFGADRVDVASLCKRASAYIWSTDRWEIEGRTNCAACTAAAKKALAEAVTR